MVAQRKRAETIHGYGLLIVHCVNAVEGDPVCVNIQSD
jgi:hypothetical protein